MPQLASSGMTSRNSANVAPARPNRRSRPRSDIGIDMGFRLAAWMGHSTVLGIAHGLGITPDRARLVIMLARLPGFAPRFHFLVADINADHAFFRVDGDHVAILDQTNGPADCRFRPDMADAEAAGGAGEAAIGDERDLVAHALAIDRRGRRQHLAHAGAAAWALIADDQNLARLVFALAHGLERIFLAVEAMRRAGKFESLHPGDLHDRTLRSKVTLKTDHATGFRKRLGR